MRVALGLDIGTTAVKAVALDDEGRVVARAVAAHDLMTPHPGWAEGDPDAWWANAVVCIRLVGQNVPLAEVASVGVSGMVPALVLLGAGNRPLRPSIQQNDARTGAEIDALRAQLDDRGFFAATGQPFSQQLIGPKLLWLARHEGAVTGAIRRVLGSYDYVTWRLAGEWSSSRTGRSSRGCGTRGGGTGIVLRFKRPGSTRAGSRRCARLTRWWAG